MEKIPEFYEQRVYAGWLGKCIGVRLGAPVEGRTFQQIQAQHGEITGYLPMEEGKVFQPDDDTNVPAILLHGVQDHHLQITAGKLGKTLLNGLGDQHGSLWWGGYGVSTEHTAYLNLKAGIDAPLSGSIGLNGRTVAEQIGGQIFSDLWGWLAPGQPEKAACYAREASSITHDGNGIYGGMFIAALVSAAFNEADPQKLVATGLEVIPEDSEYARVVEAVLSFYHQNPDDWRMCCQYLHDHFGYDRYPGVVHIIPNAGIVVMGLLYGKGDFSQSIQITCMGGWDTDCNTGNVGAILGTARGLAGIDMKWRKPVNDVLVAASVIGARNILDLPRLADFTANMGRRLAGGSPNADRARCHFEYPGSTHGFHLEEEPGNLLALRQVIHRGEGTLEVDIHKAGKKQEVWLYVETCFHRNRLSADYYCAGFSPTLYPGQKQYARLYLPPGAPPTLQAALYVWDGSGTGMHRGEWLELEPGEWNVLEWRIPPLTSGCMDQAGIAFRSLTGNEWQSKLLLGEFDWQGEPHFSIDFASAQPEFGAISGWTFLRGYWRLEDGGYHGSGPETSETYTGDIEWKDTGIRVRLSPILGTHHLVQVRVQGALSCYAAGLAPFGRLALFKKEDGIYREIISAPFEWQPGSFYEIELCAQGERLQVKVDGKRLLEWSDTQAPYLYGQIGLANFPGCHTRYEWLQVFPPAVRTG